MRFVLMTLSLTALVPALAVAENWPQFRGPNGTGRAEATGLPVKWSEEENVRWKTPIHGKGWSSPVVWGNQVWLTTATPDGHRMSAVCVDAATGKIVHDVLVFEVEKPDFCHPFNSYASPTPAIEAGRVYVHFGTYGTACLDTASGQTLWTRRDFPCDHFRGPGSSPILHQNLLIVPFDGVDQQYVVALDKATGKTVWKKERAIEYGTDNPDLKKAYATAAIVEVNGKAQVVCPSAAATVSYDPQTGQEVWRVRHGGMNVAFPPQESHGKLVLGTGAGGLGLLAVRPDGRGDVTDTHIDWTRNRGVPTRPSPLVVGDLIYLVTDQGVASCLEVETGKQVWQRRLGGEFSASPVYADGHIHCCSQEGLTHVLAPGRQPRMLAVNKLADGFMATPAVADGALFLRTETHLYRVQKP